MEAGPARHDAHGLGTRKDSGRRRAERRLEELSAGDALLQGLRHRTRLLVDLLEHVMRILALLRIVRRQLALVRGPLHGVSFAVEDAIARAADLRDVTFLQDDEPTRHRQQRRHIGRDVVLVLTQADDDRAALAGEDDAVGVML